MAGKSEQEIHQSKSTCEALHGSLAHRVESQAKDISELWKRTERPTWFQMWMVSLLTSIIGVESTYILMVISRLSGNN